MKKALLTFIVLILIFNSLTAQETKEKKNLGKIGLTFSSFGENAVIQKESLMGGPSYTGKNFYTIGINYIKPLNKHFDFESGFEYSKHTIFIKPMSYPGNELSSETKYYSINSIPISIRMNFLKYFFINGGVFLDLDAGLSHPIDSQSGIGTNIGLGIKYDFKFGLSIFVNPYFKGHSLIPFSPKDNRQRILEDGFRFGVMYNI